MRKRADGEIREKQNIVLGQRSYNLGDTQKDTLLPVQAMQIRMPSHGQAGARGNCLGSREQAA